MFVTFKSNIGMLIVRQERVFSCNACKRCIKKQFWEMQTTNLVGGWWGTISAIITPIYLITNWVEYAKTSSLEDPGFIYRRPQETVSPLSEAEFAQLAAHAGAIHDSLLRAMTDEDIAFNLAPQIGLAPEKVQWYVAMMRARGPEAQGAALPAPLPAMPKTRSMVGMSKEEREAETARRQAAAKARRDAEMQRLAQRARQGM
jgi:hypothetical protein